MKLPTSRHPDAARPDHGRHHPRTRVRSGGRRRTDPDPTAAAPGAVDFLTLGLTVAVILVGFGALGYLVDRWLGTSPWLTLVGLVLGIAAAVLITVSRVRRFLRNAHRRARWPDGAGASGRAVFAHFTLPDIPDVARRTVAMVLVIGVAALVACVSFGKPLLGLGACIGLGLGTLNFRMIGRSVDQVSASGVREQAPPAGHQHPRPAGHHHRGHPGPPDPLPPARLRGPRRPGRLPDDPAGQRGPVDGQVRPHDLGGGRHQRQRDRRQHRGTPRRRPSDLPTTPGEVPEPMGLGSHLLTTPMLGIDITAGVHPQSSSSA